MGSLVIGGVVGLVALAPGTSPQPTTAVKQSETVQTPVSGATVHWNKGGGPAFMARGVPDPPGWYAAAVGRPTKQKVLYLTFDDGPSGYTPGLLRALARHRAKATFFVSGGTSTMHRGLLKRMHAQGHAVGNHTWSHAQLTRVSTSVVRDQIQRPKRALGDLLDPCMRPPYGLIDERVAKISLAAGFQPVMWTQHIEDWQPHSLSWTVQRLRADTRPGAVILMHDTHSQSVAAVRKMLPRWKQMGYRMLPVPSCVAPAE